MAQFSQAELQEIVDRDLPGHKVIETAPLSAVADSPAESVSPSFDAMQHRFFGASSAAEEPSAPTNAGDNGDVYGLGTAGDDVPDDQIVLIENQFERPSDDPGIGPKAIVISGSEGRVVGAQG